MNNGSKKIFKEIGNYRKRQSHRETVLFMGNSSLPATFVHSFLQFLTYQVKESVSLDVFVLLVVTSIGSLEFSLFLVDESIFS